MGSKKQFCQIRLVKAVRNNIVDANYLVYKNKKEYSAVKANSASEAITLSGVEKPFKIVHITSNIGSFITEGDLKFITDENLNETCQEIFEKNGQDFSLLIDEEKIVTNNTKSHENE